MPMRTAVVIALFMISGGVVQVGGSARPEAETCELPPPRTTFHDNCGVRRRQDASLLRRVGLPIVRRGCADSGKRIAYGQEPVHSDVQRTTSCKTLSTDRGRRGSRQRINHEERSLSCKAPQEDSQG